MRRTTPQLCPQYFRGGQNVQNFDAKSVDLRRLTRDDDSSGRAIGGRQYVVLGYVLSWRRLGKMKEENEKHDQSVPLMRKA